MEMNFLVKPNLIQTPNFEKIQNWFLGKLPTLSFGPWVAQSSLDQKSNKTNREKMHKSWMHMNDLFINIETENWDVTNLPPLRWISPSRFGLARKKVWVVLSEVFFSFPGGFFLSMMTPLNLAKLDDLTAGNPACSLENLDGLLLIGQITIQLYGLQLHCIS